jgi:hypothetical protein
MHDVRITGNLITNIWKWFVLPLVFLAIVFIIINDFNFDTSN